MTRRATILTTLLLAAVSGAARGDIAVIAKPVDVAARFPEAVDYEVPLDAPSTSLGASDWTGVRELRVVVYLPPDVPRGTTMLCYLKDAQWRWYQYQPAGTLRSGRPNRIRIDMRPGVESWVPRGHNRTWDGYIAHKLTGFGIKIFNNRKWTGTVRIESITARTNDVEVQLLSRPAKLQVALPTSADHAVPFRADARAPFNGNWSNVRELRVELDVPDDLPRDAEVLFGLCDAQGKWYQHRMPRTPGDDRPIRVDMKPGVVRWLPDAHWRRWESYLAYKLTACRLRIASDETWKGEVVIKRITLVTAGVDLRELAVKDLRTNGEKIPLGEKFEMSFDLTRLYDNPFDPDQIDVRARFTAPSKETREQFGFHFREYVRRRSPLGKERLVPVGRSYWKVRWTPTETGTWTVELMLWDRHNETWRKAVADYQQALAEAARIRALPSKQRKGLKVPTAVKPRKEDFFIRLKPITFTCAKAAQPFHGFLRVDPKDRFYFAYTDGTFYYPIGQMLRSPVDLREPFRGYKGKAKEGEGTYAFERMMGRLSSNGVNLIRVWMGVWWVGLEAPREYAPGYEGLGRYNMANAWKLDHILDAAHRLNPPMKIKLNLNNHGQFTRAIDHEWYECAYNRMNGGMLRRPWEFWTDREAERYYKRRLRYVVARWAYSPEIMGWEMWNEVDLTEGFQSQRDRVRDWHRKFGRYLRQIDPWDHMISTHFCHDNRNAELIYSLDEIDFTPGDLYENNIVTKMRDKWLEKKAYNKPTFVSEFGRANYGKQMEVNFHGGLWASTVLPMSGTAMVWWWNWIDDEDLYFHYKAVDRFNRDTKTGKIEDRRGKNWRLASASVRHGDDPHAALRALGRQNDTEAHLWVYDALIFNNNDGQRYKSAPSFVGSVLEVKGLQHGRYRVEFYETTDVSATGKPKVQTQTVTHRGETLGVPLLKVQVDLAVKIKRIGK